MPRFLRPARRVRHRQAGRVILLDPAGHVLLFFYDEGRPNGPHWCTPGGGLDPGEDFRAGAARELAEETGWADIPLGDEVFRDEFVMAFGRTDVRQEERFFVARTSRPRPPVTGVEAMHRSDGIDAWRWWTLAELEATSESIWPARLAGLIRSLDAGPVSR